MEDLKTIVGLSDKVGGQEQPYPMEMCQRIRPSDGCLLLMINNNLLKFTGNGEENFIS